MTCYKAGIVGIVSSRFVPTIVQGSESWLVVQTIYAGTRQASPLENFEGATGFFPQADGSFLPVVGSLESSPFGQIRFDLAASATAAMQIGDAQDFQVNFLQDADLVKLLISGALNAQAALVS